MKKGNVLIEDVMRALMGAFLLCLMVSCLSCGKNSFDKELMKTAEEINKNCPIMVDKHTRLDNVMGGPGREFTYNYTLVDFGADDLDKDKFISLMKPKILNNVKTNKDMEGFRNKNVEIVYVYKSKDNKEMARIVVSPGDYK